MQKPFDALQKPAITPARPVIAPLPAQDQCSEHDRRIERLLHSQFIQIVIVGCVIPGQENQWDRAVRILKPKRQPDWLRLYASGCRASSVLHY